MGKWLLLDGSNLAFRSYYGVPDLKTQAGFPTNAVHGWMRILSKLEEVYQPDQIIVTFDISRCRKRLELYPGYKASRKPTPEDLVLQLPKIKALTRALGIPVLELQDIEADDIIASLAAQLAADDESVMIVSSDKDFAQCVSNHVQQVIPPPTNLARANWNALDPTGVFEKWGIYPHQIVDYLALVGDAADHIQGMDGVGPKTAKKWITQWNSLEGIYGHIEQVQPERWISLLTAQKDRLFLNRDLITLNRELDVKVPSKMDQDESLIEQLLTNLEMYATLRAYRSKNQNPF